MLLDLPNHIAESERAGYLEWYRDQSVAQLRALRDRQAENPTASYLALKATVLQEIAWVDQYLAAGS